MSITDISNTRFVNFANYSVVWFRHFCFCFLLYVKNKSVIPQLCLEEVKFPNSNCSYIHSTILFYIITSYFVVSTRPSNPYYCLNSYLKEPKWFYSKHVPWTIGIFPGCLFELPSTESSIFTKTHLNPVKDHHLICILH